MYSQTNISDSQRLQEIKGFISDNDFKNRLLLLEVYQDELWQIDQTESFKEWITKFTHYNYSTVQNWVLSDNIRSELQSKGINISKLADSAVLALSPLESPLLEEVAQALPVNATKEQVKAAVDYVKPTGNLIVFPGGSADKAKSKKAPSKAIDKETDDIIQGYREKMISLEKENLQLRKQSTQLYTEKDSSNPSSDLSNDATAVLRDLVDTLHQQLEESKLETARVRAEMESIRNQSTSDPIEDFGNDDKKTIAKQARRIEELTAVVARLEQQLNDRASTSLEKDLAVAKRNAKYWENVVLENLDNPQLLEIVANYAPKAEADVLQAELKEAIDSIEKQGEIFSQQENQIKQLRAENSKLAMDNTQLAQRVQSLEELLNASRPSVLPPMILEAIADCDKYGFRVMVQPASEGFAIKIGSETRVISEPEDVADFIYASLDQSRMTA